MLQLSEMIVLEAVRGVKTHSFSYWDAQVWATARLNQVQTIISEDFSHDQIVEGVRFFIPFLHNLPSPAEVLLCLFHLSY